ncbi:unnamed protein product [Arctia plantaginis]|uniref:NADP-dependent oxidoreductase domain-containing protein n=1 Tax=Arctia plantaginis TaxID=874455 RepID=A0A8S0ZIF4_ARCPL|nr:unnamed protein product [Arctia plantaginis]
MEHSRLLKFLTEPRYRTIMAEPPPTKVHRDYEEPPNISAEVPGEQKIREIDSNFQDATDIQEIENGRHRISHTGEEEEARTVQTDSQTYTRTVSTTQSIVVLQEESKNDEKSQAAKKSKIPLLKFKQTVEKVQKNVKEPHNKPRRSSIPKLKDSKAIKRRSSLKDDEFEKLYEEVVDNKNNVVDDKILVGSIDDPEKVETKFEEIIHAYDSNDENYFMPTEKLKLSKIPWRKKDSANKTGAVEKKKATVTDANLKDGGFKVSATTITTKRFARGNSVNLSNSQRSGTELSIEPNHTHVVQRAISLNEPVGAKTIREIEDVQGYEEKMEFEENENGRKITKTITRIPMKPDQINRSISRELNRRPASLDDRVLVNREVTKREEMKNGSSKTISRDTVSSEPQIRTEKITRSISRTFSRDGKSIILSSKNRQIYNEDSTRLTSDYSESDKFNQIPNHDFEPDRNQNALKVEKFTEDSTNLPLPEITNTTYSYIKGSIKNVERSKSVEWKAADEVLTKQYTRTYSENKFTKYDDDKKSEKIIDENKSILDDIKSTTAMIITQSEELQYSVESNDDEKHIQTNDNDNVTSVSKDQEHETILNNFKSTQETADKTEVSKNLPAQEVMNINNDVALPNTSIDTQNIPILKGNVDRLKTQLSVKDTDLTKKDIVSHNPKDEQPKKKSVLSKIAMFESKGDEYTVKVKRCLIDKKTKTVPAADNMEKSKNSLDEVFTTQPELDFLNNNVYGQSGSKLDADKITIDDGPVIVDHIMKYQEENISTIHQVQEVKIMPEAIDFTVHESNFEVNESFPGTNNTLSAGNTVKLNECYKEQITILPEKLDFIHSEEKTEAPSNLTERIRFNTSETQPDTALSLPANLNVLPRENEENIFKNSSEKNITENVENEKKAQKSKVGKLNLDLWNKQVSANKQLNNKSKQKTTEASLIKAQKIITTRAAYEKGVIDKSESITLRKDEDNTYDISKNETLISIPGELTLKSKEPTEIPTILPFRRDLISNIKLNETPTLLQERINFATNDGKLQVPVMLPETPLTISTKLKFESQKSQIEVPATISFTTEFRSNTYTAETSEIVPNTNISEVPKTISGYNSNEDSIETPRTLPSEIDIVSNETGFESPKILPERIDFKIPGDEEDIKSLVPGKDNLNPYLEVDQFNEKPKLKHNIDLDKEIPSDPELVDSEPEIRETKDTIMGKLQNKVFLITNRNPTKNKAAYYTEKSSNLTTLSIQDNINKTDINIRNKRVENNIHELDVVYDSREDKKRTKSLAELDLGDAVKGQVQRMVYRIKSVDFDRIETSRARKISLKEMPKKSSVLEKIALFEKKATSTLSSNPKPPITITTSKTSSQPSSNILTEEMYLQKIDDLSSVKLRYNKTDMLYLSLGNGDQMPAIALGTALLDPRLAPHIVSAAIDLGYRAIDTAFIYGTERAVGEGIKKKIDDGTVTREELFIMNKLWSTYHKPELVETACRASLEALGLDYFDLFMIHNPMSLKEGGDPIPQIAHVLQFSQYDYMDAWFAMETLVSKGLVKAIGVSNFNSHQIQKILDKGHIKPVVNQVECHPYLTQQPLQAFCAERNITLSCFSVLGSKGTPTEYKAAVSAAIDDPLVKVMASGLNVTPAQLLVRYQIQSGRQAVVKATASGRLYDILQALTFVLEPHHIEAINALNRNKRIFDMKNLGELHKNYPFNVPF